MKLNRSFPSFRSTLGAVLLSLCGAAPALNYDVQYTNTAPVIDGAGTDAAWATASPPLTDFRVYDNVSVPSQQQTSVRLLWDENHLYVLYEAEDNDIVSFAWENDNGFFVGQDQLEMYLDPAWTQSPGRQNVVYHIAVDPGPSAFTYTAGGNDQIGWNLTEASQVAVTQNGTNWTVEMAIAWTDLNSELPNSPGIIHRAPYHNTIWGAQFARTHSMFTSDNNTPYSKWNAEASGSFRARPIGTLTFKRSDPDLSRPDLSGRIVNRTFTFEDPPYTAGSTINGLEDWTTAYPEIFGISTAQPFNGNQSLEIQASSAGRTLGNTTYTTNTETAQYVQYALRIPREDIVDGYHHVLYVQGAYGISHVQQIIGQVWFRNSPQHGANYVTVVHYDNPDVITESTHSNTVGMLAYDTWMYITLRVDPVAKTWEVWINDHKLINSVTKSDTFHVRNRNTFRQLRHLQFYSKNFGTLPVYVDDLTYYRDAGNSSIEDWQLF